MEICSQLLKSYSGKHLPCFLVDTVYNVYSCPSVSVAIVMYLQTVFYCGQKIEEVRSTFSLEQLDPMAQDVFHSMHTT